MNDLQLTGSAAFSFDGELQTLFIARQAHWYGVVSAGSWETVIPFRFERIEALAEGGFMAWRRGRRTLYHISPGPETIRAIPARMELSGAECSAARSA